MSQSLDTRAPATLREMNVEARRRRILDAARKLIAEGGMSALSMRKLAAEAGLSVTTLYNLYGVRDEILSALIHDAIDQMEPVLDAEAPLVEDPLERCRAIITVSVAHFEEYEAIYRPMMVASFEGLSATGMSDRRMARRAAGMQRAAIEQAISKGLLRDTLSPERLGEQIYHGYEFACVQWAFGLLDLAGFRARALYGMYLALAAVASDAVRPQIEGQLRALETELARVELSEPSAQRSTS